MSESCARCGAELPRMHGELAAYCAVCGLPRLRVSPDAIVPSVTGSEQEQAAQPASLPLLDWAAALKITAGVGVVCAAGTSLLPGSVAAGTAGGLLLLLMPLLVVVVVMLYHRSRPRGEMSPQIGGRLGAALGLFVGAMGAFLAGVAGFVQRYHYHSQAVDEIFRQSTAAMTQRMEGSPLLPEATRMAQSPEMHAATLILGHLLIVLLLIVAGTVCGWMAGALLRSQRQRMVR